MVGFVGKLLASKVGAEMGRWGGFGWASHLAGRVRAAGEASAWLLQIFHRFFDLAKTKPQIAFRLAWFANQPRGLFCCTFWDYDVAVLAELLA